MHPEGRRLTCLECSKTFYGRTNGQPAKWCSDPCRKAAAARRSRERRAAGEWAKPPRRGPWRGTRTCRYCLQGFEARSSKATVCYADTCQRRKNADRTRAYLRRYAEEHGVTYQWARYADQRRASAQARRATERGARAEVFLAAEVYERDGWACGLCHEPVDPALAWPDPRSASLDHVVPLVLGGEHSRENTQLAHLSCNSAEGSFWRDLARSGATA